MLTLILFILGVIFTFAPMPMQVFINRIRGLPVSPQLPNSTPAEGDRPSEPTSVATDAAQDEDGAGSYEPTPVDIAVLRVLLATGLKFPVDIVDLIFDFAEYWAHSSTEADFLKENGTPFRIMGRTQKEDHTLLRSLPVGFTGVDLQEGVPGTGKYDRTELTPRPLITEHPPSFFSRLVNYPTPRLVHPVRKIVFTTRSRDQGMGACRDVDNYEESWTWFEAGLERFDAHEPAQEPYDSSNRSLTNVLPVEALRPIYPTFSERSPPDDAADEHPRAKEYLYDHGWLPVEERVIQRNRGRNRDLKTHVVEWRWTDDVDEDSEGGQKLRERGRGRATGDGQFVRQLKLGDVVTIWGKAKFPAWVNNIEKVKIDIYWAV